MENREVKVVHEPVLVLEVLQYLDPRPGQHFIDCTVGEGGHALAVLEKTGPAGKMLGIDADPDQIENCKVKTELFKNRVILVCNTYTWLKDIVHQYRFGPVSGILFDLGMSSWHTEMSQRGFSFFQDEALDMRYNKKSNTLTAKEIVNRWPEPELAKVISEYGEERFAYRIARRIVQERQQGEIDSTKHLAEVVRRAVPPPARHQRIHVATRTFQALRITVNNELENLKQGLSQATEILQVEGRIVVISFHSLEDRIVKNFFKETKNLRTLTKKPIQASRNEIQINRRSRSAKLRAAVKI